MGNKFKYFLATSLYTITFLILVLSRALVDENPLEYNISVTPFIYFIFQLCATLQ